MRKFLLLYILHSSVTALWAVSANPAPCIKHQPDGTAITVLLRGDEKVHWMETLDGYTLMYDKNNYIVYAGTDAENNMMPSTVPYLGDTAWVTRTSVKSFVAGLPKGIRYSPAQVNTLLQIWNIREDSRAQAEQQAAQQAAPVTGTKKALCILMSFKDKPMVKTREQFTLLMNQPDYSAEGAMGSVHDYYMENSYGQLDLQVTVVGPYTTKQNLAYYLENNDRRQEFIRESVETADADVDYREFAEGGKLETFHLIFSGYGDESINNGQQIWSHKSYLINPVVLDGVLVSVYSCSPELRGASGANITYIGVICHELCHVFGAPDYYGDDYIGTGVWDLMAGGSWGDGGRRPTHINMFLKITYGWVTPVTLNNYADIRNMPNAEQNAVAYMIEAHTSGEHYVLENRQQVGFDATLPGHGLLIYHVHKNALGGKGSNMNKAIQELYPVCATASVAIPGANPESYGNINSSGCPFPGAGNRPELSNSTTPMLFSWETRAGINKALHHIVENGGMISFDFVPEEKELKVNGKTIEITDNNILRYTAACGERNVKVEFISSGATVTLTLNGNTYPNGTTLPLTSDKTVIEIAVRTISEQSTYLLNVIQSLGETTPLYIQRWGSTLALINNPANNGGYIFDDFRWYHIDDSYTIIGTNPFIVCNDNCNAYYIRAHNSATGEWHDICPHVANNAENNVVAYPNPISAGQSLFFTLPESASRATVRIYDMAGNLIYQQRGAENHITAPAQTGLFLLQITLPDGTIQTQKIIITK